MTTAELIAAAKSELELTTVGYINKKWTIPPDGTHWANAFNYLNQVDTAPPSKPTNLTVRAI